MAKKSKTAAWKKAYLARWGKPYRGKKPSKSKAKTGKRKRSLAALKAWRTRRKKYGKDGHKGPPAKRYKVEPGLSPHLPKMSLK